MSRKLANVTNNIIPLVVGVIVLAVVVASVYYWAPWQSRTDKNGKLPVAVRDKNVITIACKVEPASLNPYTTTAQSTAQLAGIIFSGLVVFDDKAGAVPDLAETLPVVADDSLKKGGVTVTYKLRDNVSWSDGQPFTAADVTATWKFIMSSRKSARRNGYDMITAIDTPDQHTVVMHFQKFYQEYLTLFPAVLPEHILSKKPDSLERSPVGTGPYKIKEWLFGDSLQLDANDSYYAGKPKIGSVRVRFINEDKMLIAQLKAGELDLAADVDSPQIELVKDIKNYELKNSPTLEFTQLDFNCADRLLKEQQLRNALALTIDKKHICETLLSGAALQTANFIAPYSDFYDKEITGKKNILDAQSLLASSGWRTGPDGIMVKDKQRLSLELLVNSENGQRMVIADNIAAGFREIGVDVVVTKVRERDFLNRLVTGKYQMALFSVMMYPDFAPGFFWSSSAIPQSNNGYTGMNFSRFSDAQNDKLLADSGLQISTGNMLVLQKNLNQAMPVVPLYYRQAVSVQRKGLQNFNPGVTVYGNYRNSQLWQW